MLTCTCTHSHTHARTQKAFWSERWNLSSQIHTWYGLVKQANVLVCQWGRGELWQRRSCDVKLVRLSTPPRGLLWYYALFRVAADYEPWISPLTNIEANDGWKLSTHYLTINLHLFLSRRDAFYNGGPARIGLLQLYGNGCNLDWHTNKHRHAHEKYLPKSNGKQFISSFWFPESPESLSPLSKWLLYIDPRFRRDSRPSTQWQPAS